jgi:hypothetical protein
MNATERADLATSGTLRHHVKMTQVSEYHHTISNTQVLTLLYARVVKQESCIVTSAVRDATRKTLTRFDLALKDEPHCYSFKYPRYKPPRFFSLYYITVRIYDGDVTFKQAQS